MRRRNTIFRFRSEEHGVPFPSFRLNRVSGPLPCFNATSAYISNYDTDAFEHYSEKPSVAERQSRPYQAAFYWNSRYNRKGHHVLVVSSRYLDEDGAIPLREFLKRRRVPYIFKRMVTHFPYWDISWLLAILFLLCSVLWLIDGVLSLLSLSVKNGTPFKKLIPAVAFVGSNVSLTANTLLMLEAINDSRRQCFGWHINTSQDNDEEEKQLKKFTPGCCRHHHTNKRNLIGTGPDGRTMEDDKSEETPHRNWRWAPSWSELLLHYFRDIGFLAGLVQSVSVLGFYFGAIMRLPPIYEKLSVTLANVLIWLPKTIGSIGFICAGWLFMVETQQSWWRPALRELGWHVGALSIVGGIGFVISTVLSFVPETSTTYESAEYQSAVTTMWAAAAYIITSFVQWYESLEKYSVRLQDDDDGKYG